MDMENSRVVERWLNLATESENSRSVYLHYMRLYCETFNINPEQLVEEWKKVKYDFRTRETFLDEIRENLDELVSLSKKKGYSPNYKASLVYSISSFMKYNRIPVEYHLRSKSVYPIYHNRSITKDEIRTILQHSELREKLFYKMMVESVLRPHTLVRLRYKHIKKDYEKNTVPMCVHTPRSIIKGKYFDDRFTFIGKEGFELLKEYLSPREPLNDEELIFIGKKSKRSNKNEFIHPCSFSNIFRRIGTKLGLTKSNQGKPRPLRMYVLRKYFRNYAKCDVYYVQWWMQHRLNSSDEHYISNDVERHRQEYRKAYPHLRIFDDNTEELNKQLVDLARKNEAQETIIKALLKKQDDLERRFDRIMTHSIGKDEILKVFFEGQSKQL